MQNLKTNQTSFPVHFLLAFPGRIFALAAYTGITLVPLTQRLIWFANICRWWIWKCWHSPRSSRLCHEVLHWGRKLGPGWKQYANLFHPGSHPGRPVPFYFRVRDKSIFCIRFWFPNLIPLIKFAEWEFQLIDWEKLKNDNPVVKSN